MTHRFPIKEIARQAGLGTATVDRVLNDRPHVSPQTRERVFAALDELERQEQQLAARGRRLFIDIVVEAPRRFSNEIRRATENTLSRFSAGVLRPRFIFNEKMTDSEVVGILNRIARRGSDGVCLKARDIPAVRTWVDHLEETGTPVVTLVTDIPSSRRTAYVGLDNANSGRTAAYLLSKTLRRKTGTVLATRSDEAFFGEKERYISFCETLSESCPGLRIIEFSDGSVFERSTQERLRNLVVQIEDLAAVYSMGGGNSVIINSLKKNSKMSPIYIAHDLDRENRNLLREEKIDFVLHHDLLADMRNVFLSIASRHGLVSSAEGNLASDVQVVTPYNLPGG